MDIKHTGTLADTVDPDKFSIPSFMEFHPDPDSVEETMFEAYDASNRKYLLKEDASDLQVRKFLKVIGYFIDTIDNPSIRCWDNFNSDGYDGEELLSKADYLKFHAKLSMKPLTLEQLETMESKLKSGNVKTKPSTTPTVTSYVARVADMNDTRPEFKDEPEEGEEESKDMAFLRGIRKDIEAFDEKGTTLEERVAEKFQKIYETAERVASGRAIKQHAFIYGMAGIGKTHTVTEAVHSGVEKWAGKAKRPKLVVVHGDIGGALTSLLIFFFINSKNRVLLLDDADAFITNRDGAIQNFLKALLDPDNHAVTSSPTIRQNATHMYQAELANMRMEESEVSNKKLISVDISKLNENKVKVTVGKKVIEYTVTSEDEKKLLRENFQPKELTDEHKRLVESTLSAKGIRYDRFGKLVALREGDILDKVNIADVGEEDAYAEKLKVDLDGDELDNLPEEIPASWYFHSRLVMVSNLSQNDMNEAIRSRCDCRGIYLDKDEFMCRAESILDHLKIGRVSLTEPELIYWAKHESFAVLKACVADMNYKNSKINMKIGIPLELRIIASIAGLLLARYDRWHEANKMKGHDEETLQRFEKEQIAAYIKFDLLPVMAGDKSMG